jgi:hypothetical protein
VNGTQFYALHDGTGCYCTPFFRNNTEINDALRGWNCAKPCEGDKATMCGGEHMVSMWSVFDPNNVPSGSAGRDASLLATSPERFPGFPHPYNINPEHSPRTHIYVGCVNDLQTDQRRYYNETVPEGDREKMTPDVCLDFCTKVNGTQFYALHDGTGCYCTPFFRNNTEINDTLRGWNCAKPCEGDKAAI